MKAAYLILAHNQPRHLARLVRTLDCDWARFFIHIDKKADEAEFKRLLPASEKIVYLEADKRIKVYWSGYSSIAVLLNLVNAALAAAIRFDRFCFLSGADFPIKNLSRIKDEFATAKEFISVWKETDYERTEYNTPTRKNVERFHYYDNHYLNPRTTPYPQAAMYLTMALRRIRVVGNVPAIYHGSAFWALTGDCVRYIETFLRENPRFLKMFRYALIPDEMFFQTLVKESPFAKEIVHDYVDRKSRTIQFTLTEHGCHYIDWTAKNVSLPKTLDISDLDRLLESDMLFARKFDERQSAALIERLEENIR